MQDKLDDCEKLQEKQKREKKQQDDENIKELNRYKDLLSLREKEVDTLKTELRRIQKNNEELRQHIEYLDKSAKKSVHPNPTINKDAKKNSSTHFEDLTYNQGFDSQTTDVRGQKMYVPLSTNNGQMTTSSGISAISSSIFKSQAAPAEILNNIASASSERSLELMRLKKEYSQMVKNESSIHSKSPDRSGAQTVAGYYSH